MRRHFITAGLVLLALGGLWQLWGEEEDEVVEVAEPTSAAKPSKVVTTRLRSAPTPSSHEPLEDLGYVEGDEVALEELEAFQATLGTVWFTVETESGEPVESWYINSPDCGVTWTSRLAEVPMQIEAGECTFQAWRFDGALRASSIPLIVAIAAGEEVDVLLALPDERTGGLGVQIQEHDLGIEIMAVLPNTPASELGLERGDLIVEVDGVSAVDLELNDFISTMTGPEGSEVDFALAYEGDTGLVVEDLTLVRSYLNDDDDAPKFQGAQFAGRALDAFGDGSDR